MLIRGSFCLKQTGDRSSLLKKGSAVWYFRGKIKSMSSERIGQTCFFLKLSFDKNGFFFIGLVSTSMKAKVALVLGLLSVIGVYAQEPVPEKLELVTAGTVQEAESVVTRRYPGRVVSPSSIAVTSRVSGDLLEVAFKEGDFVKKGQLLYHLDDIRYIAARKSAEAKIAEYRARVAYSKANFERTQQLFDKEVSTQDELESARSEYEANKALFSAAEADLIVALDDLKNTRIYAPADGRIGINAAPVGSYVTPSSGTLATVVQLDPVRVRFALSNRDFLSIFGSEKNLREQSRIVLLLADGRRYENGGTVDFIDNTANEQTDTVQIYAKFSNPDAKLVPGSTVSVVLEHRAGTMKPAVVPSAVMYDTRSPYVYVLDAENRVARRDVVLAQTTEDLQFIQSGLKPGERIITDGTHKALPGRKVEVCESQTTE